MGIQERVAKDQTKKGISFVAYLCVSPSAFRQFQGSIFGIGNSPPTVILFLVMNQDPKVPQESPKPESGVDKLLKGDLTPEEKKKLEAHGSDASSQGGIDDLLKQLGK